MARLIRPSWAIRCVQSGCKTLFEVAKLENGKQQKLYALTAENITFIRFMKKKIIKIHNYV